MSTEKPRILVLEFHQETNTFNPIPAPFESFHPQRIFEGNDCFETRCKGHGCVQGGVDAIREMGGEVIPSVFMYAASGGRVKDEVFTHLCERVTHYIETAGELDGIYAALHGATCTKSIDDACGELLALLRRLVGDRVIAASFDLHANITENMMKHATASMAFALMF